MAAIITVLSLPASLTLVIKASRESDDNMILRVTFTWISVSWRLPLWQKRSSRFRRGRYLQLLTLLECRNPVRVAVDSASHLLHGFRARRWSLTLLFRVGVYGWRILIDLPSILLSGLMMSTFLIYTLPDYFDWNMDMMYGAVLAVSDHVLDARRHDGDCLGSEADDDHQRWEYHGRRQ